MDLKLAFGRFILELVILKECLMMLGKEKLKITNPNKIVVHYSNN